MAEPRFPGLRLLLVDDEALARQRMRRFLEKRTEELHVREAENGVQALEAIAEFSPHIVFLDVVMPGLSGFDLLYQMARRDFTVIFQTAHDDFAVKAFEENACDYLLKPFNAERFHAALDRALGSLKDSTSIDALEAYALRERRYLTRVLAKHRLGIKILDVADILYFISQAAFAFTTTMLEEMKLPSRVAAKGAVDDLEAMRRELHTLLKAYVHDNGGGAFENGNPPAIRDLWADMQALTPDRNARDDDTYYSRVFRQTVNQTKGIVKEGWGEELPK